LNKHRINTTISAKHWEILKKHTENFETQQKVLEAALENLEKRSKQEHILSPEDQYWISAGGEMKSACLVHRDIFEVLIDTANLERIIEVINNQKPTEHLIARYYQKPLKKCSLKEVIDGLIFFIKVGNIPDVINCTDEGNYYILKVVHSLNIKFSKMLETFINSLFEAYGIKIENEISEKVLFIKIYKNS